MSLCASTCSGEPPFLSPGAGEGRDCRDFQSVSVSGFDSLAAVPALLALDAWCILGVG